ncbi:flagellar basal body rod protein FlgC [Paraperlucidibaca wandonensis]|uniref:Flagellar basal-body rod protein FlgC n=1 Tax=Paraperlucidibaca wandonensis TaxID=1268273 RepID=A0ABW3HDF2_9GAMM
MSIFDIASSGMNAQMLRLNTTASNMANVDTVSTTAEGAYRARQPVFAAMMANANASAGTGINNATQVGVQVDGIETSQAEVPKRYLPGHPMADKDGYIFGSNVNAVEEMANMISASRAYQSNAEIFATAKTLMLRTLQLGQQ